MLSVAEIVGLELLSLLLIVDGLFSCKGGCATLIQVGCFYWALVV